MNLHMLIKGFGILILGLSFSDSIFGKQDIGCQRSVDKQCKILKKKYMKCLEKKYSTETYGNVPLPETLETSSEVVSSINCENKAEIKCKKRCEEYQNCYTGNIEDCQESNENSPLDIVEISCDKKDNREECCKKKSIHKCQHQMNSESTAEDFGKCVKNKVVDCLKRVSTHRGHGLQCDPEIHSVEVCLEGICVTVEYPIAYCE